MNEESTRKSRKTTNDSVASTATTETTDASLVFVEPIVNEQQWKGALVALHLICKGSLNNAIDANIQICVFLLGKGVVSKNAALCIPNDVIHFNRKMFF